MPFQTPRLIRVVRLLYCLLALCITGCGERTPPADRVDASLDVQMTKETDGASADASSLLSDGVPDAGSDADAIVATDARLSVTDAGLNDPQDMSSAVDVSDDASPEEKVCVPMAEGCDEISRWGHGDASRYPIVLVHGFFGWDEVLWVEYFYDIPATLHEAGFSVFVAQVDPINNSEVRSEQLARFVDEVLRCTCAEKLNFIGHSQGGLDARYLTGPLGYTENVASITTISSPHRGYQMAEDASQGGELGLRFLETITGLMSWFIRGNPERPNDLRETLRSMSITARQAYNEAWPDPPEVPIYSFAGFTNPLTNGGEVCARGERPQPRRGDLIEPALMVPYAILGGPGTPNDGIVTVEACIWGRFMGCIAADHFDQIGQISGLSDFNFRRFYREQARFLAAEGH